MTIKTYWALSVDDSKQYAEAKDAQINAHKAAKDYIENSGFQCDGVFISTTGTVFLGFKGKPTNSDLKKKPDGDHEGFALYTAKANTLTAGVLSEAKRLANEAVCFNDFCKTKWPGVVREVMGQGNSPHSFTLTKTAFGWLGDRVVLLVPFSDQEVINISIIPPGFVELTATEYANLNR